jgi:hypothetical protein
MSNVSATRLPVREPCVTSRLAEAGVDASVGRGVAVGCGFGDGSGFGSGVGRCDGSRAGVGWADGKADTVAAGLAVAVAPGIAPEVDGAVGGTAEIEVGDAVDPSGPPAQPATIAPTTMSITTSHARRCRLGESMITGSG